MLLLNDSYCGMIHKSYKEKRKGEINNYQDVVLMIFSLSKNQIVNMTEYFLLDLVDPLI